MQAIGIRVRFTPFVLATAAVVSFLCGCGGGSDRGGSISGEVTAPGSAAAAVYVLAIPFEHRGMIRKLETEANPVQSGYVASSVRLDGPGAFTVSGLPAGDYLLWAWLDKNGNGAVEHENFAEPVGWLQSEANLGMNRLTLAAGQQLEGKDITLHQPTPFPAGEVRVDVGAGGGVLKTVKGNRTLLSVSGGECRGGIPGRRLSSPRSGR